MKYERATLSELARKTFDIGYVGEQNHTRVVFSCYSLFDEYPNAVATMVVKPPVGDVYPVVVDREQSSVVWYVSASDVAHAGTGQYQLTFTDGEEIIKQAIGSFTVKPSLVGSGETPDPVADWIANANEVLVEVEHAVNSKIDNPSTPGTNGQVLTSDGNGGTEWRTPSGGGGGTSNYNDLSNKPRINNVTLSGNKSLADLGIAAASDIPTVHNVPSGGTTGQVLAKNSNTNYDLKWVNQSTGSSNYTELTNKPQINSVTLTGNKTFGDLGIHNVPSGGTTGQVLKKTSNTNYDVAWGDESGGGGGGGTSDYTDLTNKPQINSVTLAGNKSLNDLGIAAVTDIPDVTSKADKVVSAINGNFASLDSNGNLTDSGKKASDFITSHQDISGKADKVSSATNGNFAGLDSNGNLTDSGHKHSDYLTSHQDISGKADKVSSATNNNFAGLDSNGNLKDSGYGASSFATTNAVNNSINSNLKTRFKDEFKNIADIYDGTKVYQEGDLCTYYDVSQVYPSNQFVPTKIYRHKSWGATTPVAETDFNSARWDVVTVDELLSDLDSAKISEPSSDGTSGQVLTTDGQGGRTWTTVQGGGGGTSDYTALSNKPQINSVTLSGNKSLSDIGAASEEDMEEVQETLGLSGQHVDYGTDNPLIIDEYPGTIISLEFDTASTFLASGVNLYPTANEEVIRYKVVYLPVMFPAGDYIMSAYTTSTDTEVGYSHAVLYNSETEAVVTTYSMGLFIHNERTSSGMTASGTFDSIVFYALSGMADSEGVTTIYSNIQFQYGSTASEYTVYAGQVGTVVSGQAQISAIADKTFVFSDDGSDIHGEGSSIRPVIPDLQMRVSALEQPLKNKKILVFGDSIWANDRINGVSDFLHEYSGATIYNGAVGGTRITGDRTQYEAPEYRPFDGVNLIHAFITNTWTDQDASASSVASYVADETLPMLKALDPSLINIVILAYGTNDFTSSRTIAQIQAAYETAVSEILTAYPSIRIIEIAPPWRKIDNGVTVTDGDVYENSNNDTLRDVADGIIESAKAHHITCINMLDELPWRAETATYYMDSDAVHPNTEGNKIYACIVTGKLVNTCKPWHGL